MQWARHSSKKEEEERTVMIRDGPRFAIADDYRELLEEDNIPVYENL